MVKKIGSGLLAIGFIAKLALFSPLDEILLFSVFPNVSLADVSILLGIGLLIWGIKKNG